MIIKGNTRSNGGQLGAYLLDNAKNQNERINVLEVKSGTTQDAKTALLDMDLATELTRGKKGLYHCVLNPVPGEELTAENWAYAADTVEKQLGFEGQNRVIVMHEKRDKDGQMVQHVHAVWQREKDGKLLQLSHNYLKHDAAREEIETTLDLKRTRQPRDTKQTLAEVWKKTKDGPEFVKEAEKQGFTIAKGDRRAYKVQTPDGLILDLPRQLPKEVKTRDVAERLKDVPLPQESELDRQKGGNVRQPERTASPEPEKNSRAAPRHFAGEKEKIDRRRERADEFKEAANDNLKQDKTEPKREAPELSAADRMAARLEQFKAEQQQRKQPEKPLSNNHEQPLTAAERMAKALDKFKEAQPSSIEHEAAQSKNDITDVDKADLERRLKDAIKNREDFGLER